MQRASKESSRAKLKSKLHELRSDRPTATEGLRATLALGVIGHEVQDAKCRYSGDERLTCQCRISPPPAQDVFSVMIHS